MAAMLLILLVTAIALYLLNSAKSGMAIDSNGEAYDQSLLDAQSGLERVKYELYQSFLSNSASGSSALGWFNTWSSNSIGTNPVYRLANSLAINQSTVSVWLASVVITNSATSTYAEVTLISRAVHLSERKIQERLRIGAPGSPVFDYAFFVDHVLSLAGSKMTVSGDVRSNTNITFSATPRVNGTAHAAGTVSGARNTWSLSQYFSSATTRAPPADPTSTGGAAWTMGYKPAAATNCIRVLPLSMPVVGSMTQYVATAISHGGMIRQGSSTIVSNSYSGPGPDGLTGTADDGCLILDGLTTPIRIDGPVVVAADVIIRGQVGGQGCLYAGRNIHIVDDLTYTNPPAWPKPDTAPNTTANANRSDDLLVLVAKGNIVIGNYTSSTWSNSVWSLMTAAAAVVPCASDPSDAPLGYDSDNNPANGYRFDGRHYANEANDGRRLSGVGTNTVPRRYFDSSLANATVNALAGAEVQAVDAVLYSNHAIIGLLGKTGKITPINGAMVCHDEMIAFNGDLLLNWDIRMGSRSVDAVPLDYLPTTQGGSSSAFTRTWREVK
ncbi:MAG: hypothetical protein C0404_03855 [Verrucomicrobia bacterium]|nr:hypothetical protein [Verrucomicrobiota bacterium]